ncbi:hypothetical protein GCM10027446_25310 [Angustibacter peucedani]
MTAALVLPDRTALADLGTFVARARRVDPDGAVRLVASGEVLAAYVSPVHGGGGPTVLGLRVVPLAEPATCDRTVALAAVLDRLARADADVVLPLPPADVQDAGWAGVSPPRSGWEAVGAVDAGLLGAAARAGVDEIAGGAGEGAGGHAVARLRALVWGRDLDGIAGVPAGAAFAADALGFVTADEPVTLHACGPWRRLSTPRGHVLARRSLL